MMKQQWVELREQQQQDVTLIEGDNGTNSYQAFSIYALKI